MAISNHKLNANEIYHSLQDIQFQDNSIPPEKITVIAAIEAKYAPITSMIIKEVPEQSTAKNESSKNVRPTPFVNHHYKSTNHIISNIHQEHTKVKSPKCKKCVII